MMLSAAISLLLLMPAYPWVRQAVSEEPRPITQPAVCFVAKDVGPLGKRGWSKIITRETIEDEVERLKILIDKDVTTLEQFARGGYKKARRHFSELAALFAIIEQNDVMTRWMREAPDLKNRFARSARACKVGSRQAFTEASRRKEDLKTIVGGGKLQLADKIEKRPWGEILDRSPLMQRMNILFQEELKVHVADKKTFAANRDRIKHNAELISAISTILRQPSMEDASEDDYAAHTKRLTDAAQVLSRAAQLNNQSAAKAALTAMAQNCANCHAEWR